MDPRRPRGFPRKRPTVVRPPRRRPRRVGLIALSAAILLLLVTVPALIRFYVDYLWFREIGFTPVLLREVVAQAALLTGVAAVAFGVAYGSARLAQRGTLPFFLQSPEGLSLDVGRLVRGLTLPAALLVAVPFGLAARHSWMVVLQALHATRFDLADPIFGRDVSYYVFLLPLLSAIMTLLFALGVLALLAAAISYWLRGQLGVAAGGLAVDSAASRHLAAVGAFLFVVVAARIWLVGLPELLYSTTGPLVGVSYTDQYAKRPGLHVSAFAALAAAALLVAAARRGRLVRGAAFAVGGFAVMSILARGIYPAALQRLVVDPTELTRETPFLAHHIELTRRAWGLDRRRDARAQRRRRPSRSTTSRRTPRRSRTCASGTANRCCRRSASFRRSAPTTTSWRWTTTATGSTAATGRCCSRRASSTPPRCPRARSSTSTSRSRTAWA